MFKETGLLRLLAYKRNHYPLRSKTVTTEKVEAIQRFLNLSYDSKTNFNQTAPEVHPKTLALENRAGANDNTHSKQPNNVLVHCDSSGKDAWYHNSYA